MTSIHISDFALFAVAAFWSLRAIFFPDLGALGWVPPGCAVVGFILDLVPAVPDPVPVVPALIGMLAYIYGTMVISDENLTARLPWVYRPRHARPPEQE